MVDVLLKAIDQAVPASAKNFTLRRLGDTLYQVDSIDHDSLKHLHFFIAVYLPAQSSQWIEQFAKQVKIGAIAAINSIIASALPGAQVRHLQRPPAELTIKAGYEYFLIEVNNEFWQQIVADGNLAIFIPNAFKSAAIELISLEEG